MKSVLDDLEALEQLIVQDSFEKGIVRIGAEQELNFVDKHWRPAPIGHKVLEDIGEDYLTTEYGKYNLEINMPPYELNGKCLSLMHNNIKEKLTVVAQAAKARGARIVLCGILPSIRRRDITLDSLTPEPRYEALLKVATDEGNGTYQFYIKGIDELYSANNPLAFGTTMTSMQVHLQVSADDIVRKFNWAQALAAPQLACATNSPLLMNKRLWHETRIALFEQSTDTRYRKLEKSEHVPRVNLGTGWANENIIELFREDVALHPPYLYTEVDEIATDVIKEGKTPSLSALCFHHGTVYQWNRACYGVADGVPHLRIENRVLPSGPSLPDEMANVAFWIGAVQGITSNYHNIHQEMDFNDIKENFLKAAQHGLHSQFRWIDGEYVSAKELILDELLPIARGGLEQAGVDEEDIATYLRIIEERTSTGKTGSQWILDSFNRISKTHTVSEASIAVTAGLSYRAEEGKPVHEWNFPEMSEGDSWIDRYPTVGSLMVTEIYTVREDDLIDLAANIMGWKKVGSIPVLNKEEELVGIINKSTLLDHFMQNKNEEHVLASQIMISELTTAESETSLGEALDIMIDQNLNCLPVITEDGHLAGMITETDILRVSKQLYNELLNTKEDEK